MIFLSSFSDLLAQNADNILEFPVEAEIKTAPLVETSPASDPAQAAALVVPFFLATASGDAQLVRDLVADGADPNSEAPKPPPRLLLDVIEDDRIRYYLEKDEGFTALMLASSLGHEAVVEALLALEAERFKKTRRHKSFALQFAARARAINIMRRLMLITPDSEAARTIIRIDLAAQTATLWKDGQCINSSPISSGRKQFPTPPGEYLVTDKYQTWTSTIYRVKMPYFMRLSCGDFGLHAGALPGYPASHGCIRLPHKNAKEFFEQTPVGALVSIE